MVIWSCRERCGRPTSEHVCIAKAATSKLMRESSRLFGYPHSHAKLRDQAAAARGTRSKNQNNTPASNIAFRPQRRWKCVPPTNGTCLALADVLTPASALKCHWSAARPCKYTNAGPEPTSAAPQAGRYCASLGWETRLCRRRQGSSRFGPVAGVPRRDQRCAAPLRPPGLARNCEAVLPSGEQPQPGALLDPLGWGVAEQANERIAQQRFRPAVREGPRPRPRQRRAGRDAGRLLTAGSLPQPVSARRASDQERPRANDTELRSEPLSVAARPPAARPLRPPSPPRRSPLCTRACFCCAVRGAGLETR